MSLCDDGGAGLAERLATAPHPMDAASLPLRLDVVSVQSQVVYGRVGNAVAVPALEAHGLSVAAVPTVLLSNTPHYPSLHGGVIPLAWFEGYLSDLRARGALRQLRAVVVGYLGEPAQAAALAVWIARLREELPDLQLFVDPVIGDHDSGIYVDPDMIDAYRRHLLPLADGITPNAFELSQLEPDQGRDPESVVVTSAAPEAWEAGCMWVAVVTRDTARVIRHPRLSADTKGTGDLFSAELTARLLAGIPLDEAVAQACERVVAALRHTLLHRSGELLLPASSLSP
jgi:pyridoxine kinase